MKRLFAWGTALLLVGGMQAASLPVDEPITPVDYVSTLVGTQSKHSLSTGNTYPAVAMPWGMNFWTPQTGTMGNGWAYTYDADKIRGFKQTHQPSPWINDYGQFAIMPVTGKVAFDQDERASWFSHKAETATPYYYKVYLADHDVTAEFAPTERAAAFRFTFPETEEAYVVVDAMDNGSFVKIIPAEKKIIGYTTKNSGGVPSNFKNYFVLQFDKPFTYTAAVKDGKIDSRTTEAGANHAGGIIGFHTLRGEQVNVRVASSFISHEQAELNLKELGGRTLEEVAKAGRDEWNRVLGRIEVQDTDLDRLRTFYSCFYRSVLFPRSFYEIDAQGQVMHYSPYNGEVLPGYMFTDTGFWDTFRCLFPFLNLMYPSMNAKMQEGLANTYKESGFLPEWASPGHRGCMVGDDLLPADIARYADDIRPVAMGVLSAAEMGRFLGKMADTLPDGTFLRGHALLRGLLCIAPFRHRAVHPGGKPDRNHGQRADNGGLPAEQFLLRRLSDGGKHCSLEMSEPCT